MVDFMDRASAVWLWRLTWFQSHTLGWHHTHTYSLSFIPRGQRFHPASPSDGCGGAFWRGPPGFKHVLFQKCRSRTMKRLTCALTEINLLFFFVFIQKKIELNRCCSKTVIWCRSHIWLLWNHPFLSHRAALFWLWFPPPPPPPPPVAPALFPPSSHTCFGQEGWSVRIALFTFEWQRAMSNRWWYTKWANPRVRGNSLMWWNLKGEGSGVRPRVIPHYH